MPRRELVPVIAKTTMTTNMANAGGPIVTMVLLVTTSLSSVLRTSLSRANPSRTSLSRAPKPNDGPSQTTAQAKRRPKPNDGPPRLQLFVVGVVPSGVKA